MPIGLHQSLKHLSLVGKTNRCNVDMLVSHKDLTDIFLSLHLASTGKLGHGTGRGRLGLLTTRIAVHFRINNKNVHVVGFKGFDVI